MPTIDAPHGDVAVVRLDNPPINGLSLKVRRALVDAIDRANGDPAVKAIVLIGAGANFSGGADIREFNTPAAGAEPNLRSLISIVEESRKPVVAAIAGVCMGGGLELAMGCHYRVVAPGAQIALPEVKLGLLPGAGGTQRLPRLIGLEAALNMIVSGATVPSEALIGTALIDKVAPDDLARSAVAFAAEMAAAGGALPRARERKVDYPNHEAYLQFVRNSVTAASGPFPAPLKCVDAVAASVTKDFEVALALERQTFAELLHTPQSHALIHAFLGERQAAKIADVPESTPIRPIRSVAVIGAGTMGSGIATVFAEAGLPVALLEANGQALERGLANIRRTWESAVKKGRLTPQGLQERTARLRPVTEVSAIADADLAVEAVFEDIDVKQSVFEMLDRVMKPGAILASNTSTLDLNRIASFTGRPQDVVGLHFFSPANVMRLLEVVRGRDTGKDVLATVMKLAKTIRKVAVVAGVCDGFIGNRMIEQYGRQAAFLLEEGALPAQVDKALEAFGMAMGPFRMSDLAGNDIGWEIRKRRRVQRPHFLYSTLPDRLCEQGRFGQKTGSGWYTYRAGDRTAYPDPQVDALVVAHSAALGLTRREIPDEEIVGRCVFALVNEGARLLEEGIAQSASDIDMVYLNGYGFPLHRGGPMLYADTVGLYHVLRAIERFAANPHGDPAFWQAAPLLARLAAEGKTFN
jgi:3-hydroxyacyl-CoA dehydrogenase